jgi:hypothetical protein
MELPRCTECHTRAIQVHAVSKHELHFKASKRVMNYVVSTKEKGYTFKPDHPNSWDGKNTRKFKIMGKCDSEYAKDTSRRSVNAGIIVRMVKTLFQPFIQYS